MYKKNIKLSNIKLKELIRESIRSILYEELSISDKVKFAVDNIIQMLKQQQKPFYYYFYNLGDVLIKPTFEKYQQQPVSVSGTFFPEKNELHIIVPLDKNGYIYDFLARKPTISIVG